MLAKKYLLNISLQMAFVKTNTINCDVNNNAMFPNTSAFAFTRQLMKQSFTGSTNLSMSTKVLIWKKVEDEPAYCPDRYKLLQILRPVN